MSDLTQNLTGEMKHADLTGSMKHGDITAAETERRMINHCGCTLSLGGAFRLFPVTGMMLLHELTPADTTVVWGEEFDTEE